MEWMVGGAAPPDVMEAPRTPPMPDFTPPTEVVQAPWAGTGGYSYGMLLHPIVKSPDGRLAVDVWFDPRSETTMAKVWRRQDHPNLGNLPRNVPRKVKALYRADGQLAFMRHEGDVFTSPAWLAMNAWDAYWQATLSARSER